MKEPEKVTETVYPSLKEIGNQDSRQCICRKETTHHILKEMKVKSFLDTKNHYTSSDETRGQE